MNPGQEEAIRRLEEASRQLAAFDCGDLEKLEHILADRDAAIRDVADLWAGQEPAPERLERLRLILEAGQLAWRRLLRLRGAAGAELAGVAGKARLAEARRRLETPKPRISWRG